MALADGHGSARCFRSDRGARFAVEAAQETLQELVEQLGASTERLREIGASLADGCIARSIYARWNNLIRADLARDPLAAIGEASLPVSGTAVCTASASAHLPLAFLPREMREPYGATLLAALLTDAFGLFLQLGDGDMLVLDCDGKVERVIEDDPENIANQTRSLCSDRPLDDIRTRLQVWSGRLPRLILLSTDGYSNAFSERQGFERVAVDIDSLLAEPDGEPALRRNLRDWLAHASTFSGDDVSAALAWRAPRLEAAACDPPASAPADKPPAAGEQTAT